MEMMASGKTSADGALSPYDFTLIELKIVNASGTSIDINFIYSEINIYEDIFNNVINGDILLTDSSDIINRMGIHGNEFISIVFKSPGMKRFEKVFRIYKISEYSLQGTSAAKYKLHFCSEEFLLNQQYFISKSFRETRLSDVVRIIAQNFLKISSNKFSESNIEESTLLLTPEKNPLIVPNLRPLEAINWISSFALSKDLSPGFFFYETADGFKFSSMSSIYSQIPKRKLYYSAKNLVQNESIASQHSKLDELQFRQVFDTLESISSGAFASQLITLDVMNRTVEGEVMSSSIQQYKTLNQYLPYNNARNRIGSSISQASGYIRMFPKFQDNLASQWLLMRASRLALLNNTRLHIDIPGDSSLSVGDIVYVSVPQNAAETNPDNISEDRYMSGNYLITGLRHHLLDTRYHCYAQLCKDSVNVNLNYSPPVNSMWNTVINS